MTIQRLKFISAVTMALVLALSAGAQANQQILQTPLPGNTIMKYVEPLPTFTNARVSALFPLSVSMEEFQQKVLPAPFYSGLPAPYNAGTYVWGYKINKNPPTYPARTLVALRGWPTIVTYKNNLVGPNGKPPVLQKYLTIDQTLHWADPLGLDCMMNPMNPACFTPYGYPDWPGMALENPMPSGAPVPAVVHLHGGEVPSAFDGGPDQWFTPNGIHGPGYVSLFPVARNQAVYRYPNGQEATTLFFHDHTLGATRINLYAGLAGFYFIRDLRDTGLTSNPIRLPAGPYEIELAIQDRMFDTNGQWLFPDEGLNTETHPFWRPEFFGDAVVVNGKTWPFLNVEPRRYRFRIVNGSNARFYNMGIVKDLMAGTPGPAIWQIGTDGGFLAEPVRIALPDRLLLGPGERADIIVDFSGLPLGTTLTLVNDAPAPFPMGEDADPNTVGQIMQFRVTVPIKGKDRTCNPDPATANGCKLRSTCDPLVRLANPVTGTLAEGVTTDTVRQLVLNEVEGAEGPLEVLLNNTKWIGLKESTITSMDPQPVPGSEQIGPNWATELPRVGSTEVWEIINLTADAHPIHLHLVQFQLVNRQAFDADAYLAAWEAAFPSGMFEPGDGPPNTYNVPNLDGAVGGNIPVSPFLLGSTLPPLPNEAGWKDTVVMKPGEVTRIVVRFAPQDVPVGGVFAGLNLYPFDPTLGITTPPKRDCAGNPGGPGYVWHCHIVDHEDNEMMRPYVVKP